MFVHLCDRFLPRRIVSYLSKIDCRQRMLLYEVIGGN
jgi:hypothetical protein